MNPFEPPSTKRDGPEAIIQERLVGRLKALDWVTMVTHGNIYQYGFPDVYAANRKHGPRWIEVKALPHYSFTPAQCHFFPLLHSAGVGIWILVDSTDAEIKKLFKPANWMEYYLRWVNSAK